MNANARSLTPSQTVRGSRAFLPARLDSIWKLPAGLLTDGELISRPPKPTLRDSIAACAVFAGYVAGYAAAGYAVLWLLERALPWLAR